MRDPIRGVEHPRSLYTAQCRTAALYWRYCERWRQQDIARHLGCNVQTVRRWCRNYETFLIGQKVFEMLSEDVAKEVSGPSQAEIKAVTKRMELRLIRQLRKEGVAETEITVIVKKVLYGPSHAKIPTWDDLE